MASVAALLAQVSGNTVSKLSPTNGHKAKILRQRNNKIMITVIARDSNSSKELEGGKERANPTLKTQSNLLKHSTLKPGVNMQKA